MKHVALENSSLLSLIDDAIKTNLECSNDFNSLSDGKDEALRQVLVLEKQLEVAKGNLEVLCEQLKDVEEEAHLTTAQLHQVQEELEHYFILSRKQSMMLDKSAKLQERTAILLANVNR